MTIKTTLPIILPEITTQLPNKAPIVISDIVKAGDGNVVTNIVSLTQSEYDALTPNASTLYFITS